MLNYLTRRHFPRAMPRMTTQQSVKDRVEAAQKAKEQQLREQEEEEIFKQRERYIKSDPAFGYGEERVHDDKFKDYSPLSLLHIPMDRVPHDIQKRMIKVFGKHSIPEVRHWSKKLMQSY